MDWVDIVFWVVAVGAVLYAVAIYNTLVSLKNRYKNAFAQIDIQLKRRHDLIPNLVSTAKAYLKHESETLQAVVQARQHAVDQLNRARHAPDDPRLMDQLTSAETALSSALGKLNLVVEAYPDLKASAPMMQLSEQITTTENKVAFARQAYNDAVMAYNSYRQSFPPVAFCGVFGHRRDAALLKFEDRGAMETAPKVSF